MGDQIQLTYKTIGRNEHGFPIARQPLSSAVAGEIKIDCPGAKEPVINFSPHFNPVMPEVTPVIQVSPAKIEPIVIPPAEVQVTVEPSVHTHNVHVEAKIVVPYKAIAIMLLLNTVIYFLIFIGYHNFYFGF